MKTNNSDTRNDNFKGKEDHIKCFIVPRLVILKNIVTSSRSNKGTRKKIKKNKMGKKILIDNELVVRHSCVNKCSGST